jgi:CheY-like chemotaxis protein
MSFSFLVDHGEHVGFVGWKRQFGCLRVKQPSQLQFRVIFEFCDSMVFLSGESAFMNQPGTILYAEDDESDAFVFCRALAKAEVRNPVVHVLDGEAALKYLTGVEPYSDRDKYPFPCLLITDLKMPGFSGFDLLAEIKEKLKAKALRVIVLTASVADSDRERCRQLGSHGYFVKPTDFMDFVALAREVKKTWLQEAP